MLDRAPQETQDEAKPRPVAFRGAGFTPGAGRYSGWIALPASCQNAITSASAIQPE